MRKCTWPSHRHIVCSQVFCLTVGCDVDEYAAFKVSWQAMFAERLSGRSGRRAASQPLLAHERHAEDVSTAE